jgi:hypothetical protein
MAEFDHGIKRITDTTAKELARIAHLKCDRLQPLESTLPATTELLADRAFLARCKREQFVVYYEFYTQWDRNAPWDMLAKSGLLSQRLHLPTVCLAFVLRPRGFRSQAGHLRLHAAGGPTQHLWYREVCLWEVKPEEWWEKVPGLMALYPLCRHGRLPREAIRHAADAIERTVTAQGEREDQLFLLYIFGELAYPRVDVERIIGSNAMIRESKLGRRLRREGQVEAGQTALLIVLRNRFGDDAAAELGPAVNSVDDPEMLEHLLKQVVAGCSLDNFRSALTSAHASVK